MDCQLFCKCSNCDSDSLLAAKIPIWTVNEYRACCHCGSACISSQCSDYEYCCSNCYLALQAVDIESEAEEEFMQIFEDGVASASNPVSNFSDAAVISMESNTVQVEEVNSRIVADLQDCIVLDSKKKSATRVNIARGLQAKKKSSKKTTKVSLKGVKKSNKDIIVRALSNPNSEQLVTHVSNVEAVSSSISQAPTIPMNVLERYLKSSSSSLVMSPPSAAVIHIMPKFTSSDNNSVSSVSHSTFGQSTASSNSSMSKVVERANRGTKRNVSEHGQEDVVIKKRKKTSEIWQHGVEILAQEENTDQTYKAFKCSYCSWIGKITASGSTTIVRNHFEVCKPFIQEMKRRQLESLHNEDTPDIGVRTPSQLTAASKSSPSVGVEPKVQTLLVASKNGSLNFVNPQNAINFSHLRGLINDWVTVCEIPFEKVEAATFKDMFQYVYPQYKQVGRRTVRDDIVHVMSPQRKDSMKKFLQSCITTENTGFSFTTDIYTNTTQKKAYMAVTIHFIVRAHDWQLYNTLLGFELIESPHTGQNIAAKFSKIITNYGLEKNVLSCTMDNASNNDTFVAFMKSRKRDIPLMLDGEFFQTRCNAHCYNLIAQDGLALLKEPLAGDMILSILTQL